jgi:hypothetical protein
MNRTPMLVENGKIDLPALLDASKKQIHRFIRQNPDEVTPEILAFLRGFLLCRAFYEGTD